MLINKLPPSEKLFNIHFSDYAERHFLKRFKKDYPGIRWNLTEKSIKEDLRRLRMPNNTTQNSSQIDELQHKDDYWIAKYDFAVAGSGMSTKASGNRCILFIDNKNEDIDILLIYGKTDLPKNKHETSFINDTIREQFKEVCFPLFS